MAMRQPLRWQDVRDELKADWEITILAFKRPWEEVQDDVRFGWECGTNPQYRTASFDDVEGELQARWEAAFPHARYEDWRSLKDAVRVGFDRATQP